MSFAATAFRPLATSGWGGRAASTFRGALSADPSRVVTPLADVQSLMPSWRGQIGTLIARNVAPARNFTVSGVTRDAGGAALGNCWVELFSSATDMVVAKQFSDASGNFSFVQPGTGPFYLIAYLTGAPDIGGTSLNTLMPVAI